MVHGAFEGSLGQRLRGDRQRTSRAARAVRRAVGQRRRLALTLTLTFTPNLEPEPDPNL